MKRIFQPMIERFRRRRKVYLYMLGIGFGLSILWSGFGGLMFLKDKKSYSCGEIELEFYRSYAYLRVKRAGGDTFLECKKLAGQNYDVVLCRVEEVEQYYSYLLFDIRNNIVYPAVGKRAGEKLNQDECLLAGLYYSPDLGLCVEANKKKACKPT